MRAVRSLVRRPGLAAIIVVTLALGIGANTAIYSVASAVILKPLPFRDPDRLIHIFEGSNRDRYQPGRENSFISVRAGTFHDWQEQSRSFERIVATRFAQVVLTGDHAAVTAEGSMVSEGFFETLGVSAFLGRYLTQEDYALDRSRVVVLSHRLWRERYNADPAVVGKDIRLDNASYRVVGVMPAGYYPARWYEAKFWMPLRWEPATKHSRVHWGLILYARLKHDVNLTEAQAEIDTISARIRAAHPDDYDGMGAVVAPVAGYMIGHHERLFLLLLGAVALVLLIACANVANLLLARALEREREFAVRAALGASRGALMRQVLGESLILAGAGGLFGVVLAPLLTRPVLALLPAASRIPRLDEVRVDGGVLLFTLVISLLAGLLFGLVPGLRACGADVAPTLKESGRGGSLSRRGRRLSDALVMAEVALSVVLLAGAGLLVKVFLTLLHSDPGLRPEQALAAQITIPSHRYGTFELGGRNPSRLRLYERLEQAVRAVPGVQAAGITMSLPLRHGPNPWSISIEGRPPLAEGGHRGDAVSRRTGLPDHGSVSIQRVSPGYFEALGIPLIRGRFFSEQDRPEAPMTALINQTAARKFFPGEDPVGKRIAVDMTSYLPKMTIVGVVGDSRMNGLDREIYPQVFWPMAHLPSANAWVVASSSGEPQSVAAAVRRAVRDVDPELAIVELDEMNGVLRESLWRQRLAAVLVGLLAALAALIAVGGLYAVISYAVARQTKELGMRVALGATERHIAAGVLGHGLRLTGIGAVLGTLLSILLSRSLESLIPTPDDTAWMALGVAGVLAILTVVACWIPVRRALAVDPVTALRVE